MVSISGLSYSYVTSPDKRVFQGLSMEAGSGEFISVIGRSGCGKSTLFKIVAGLQEPSEGEISIGGQLSTAASRLGQIGYMPQQDLLLPWRTVLENCLLPAELKGSRSKSDMSDIIRGLLTRLGLSHLESAYPHQLSGGMRQRIAFLRTLLTGSKLLLLDEPFGALDALTKREMHRWLLELWSELHTTVLFITHDLEEALLLSDRIYLMPGTAGQEIQELKVDLPRPRHYRMNYEPRFIELREELERKFDDCPDM